MKSTLAAVVGLALFGVACSSSAAASAQGLHSSLQDKYSADFEEVGTAFGEPYERETFKEWVADDGCDPMDDEAKAMGAIFLAPVLVRHGHDYVEFLADWQRLQDAVAAEGLCKNR